MKNYVKALGACVDFLSHLISHENIMYLHVEITINLNKNLKPIVDDFC